VRGTAAQLLKVWRLRLLGCNGAAGGTIKLFWFYGLQDPGCTLKSSSTFRTQPLSASFFVSSLTCLRSTNASESFILRYVDSCKIFCNIGISVNPITFEATLHMCALHNALPPLGSVCFLPSKTPLMRHSCKWGVHTAERLDPAAGDGTRRREKANSFSVVTTLNA